MKARKTPAIPAVLCICGKEMDPQTHLCTGCGRTVAQAEELASLMLALRSGNGIKH